MIQKLQQTNGIFNHEVMTYTHKKSNDKMMMRSDQSPPPQVDDDDNCNMSSYDTPPEITTSNAMSISPPDIMRISVVEDGRQSHVLIPQRNSSTLKVDINDLPSLPFLDGPTMDNSQAKNMNDTTPIRRSVTQETKPSIQEEWKQRPMPKPIFQDHRQSGARCA